MKPDWPGRSGQSLVVLPRKHPQLSTQSLGRARVRIFPYADQAAPELSQPSPWLLGVLFPTVTLQDSLGPSAEEPRGTYTTGGQPAAPHSAHRSVFWVCLPSSKIQKCRALNGEGSFLFSQRPGQGKERCSTFGCMLQ